MCCLDNASLSQYKVHENILHRFEIRLLQVCVQMTITPVYIEILTPDIDTFSRVQRNVLASCIPNFKSPGASIWNLHEFICLKPQTNRLYFQFGVYNFIYEFHHFCSKIFLYNNPFHVWEALEMRKNYVVFGPNSGRGISKTKALFASLLQY